MRWSKVSIDWLVVGFFVSPMTEIDAIIHYNQAKFRGFTKKLRKKLQNRNQPALCQYFLNN